MTNIVGCFSDKGKHSVSLILEWNVKPTFLRTFATEVEGVYASGKKKKKNRGCDEVFSNGCLCFCVVFVALGN